MVTQTYTCKEIKKTKLKEGREVGGKVRGGRGREGEKEGKEGGRGRGERKGGRKKGRKDSGTFSL